MAERKLKNAGRLLHPGMWLLFLAAASLMAITHVSGSARTGSVWTLALVVMAIVLLVLLRVVVRHAGHRKTEDKLVNEVKTYLQGQESDSIKRPVPAVAVPPAARPAPQTPMPTECTAFMPLDGVTLRGVNGGDLVVFDAIAARQRSTPHVAWKSPEIARN